MSSCRVCLGDCELVDIFGTDEDIASNIMLFASVQVIKGDDLPQYICNLCKVELDICIGFKSKCEATYETLKNSWSGIKVDDPLEGTSSSYNWEKEEVHLDYHTHSDSYEETGITDTFCEQCKIRFPSHTFFNIHIEKKHSRMCNICNLQFSGHKALKEHLKCAHQIVLQFKKSKQCHTCGKCFNYNAELIRHSFIHSGTKQFKCTQCGKYFSSRGGLNKHIARHSSVSKFSCSTCPKTFIHESNLRDHIKTHSNQRKYSCIICNKSFKAKRTLAFHLKIHRNERDFPCSKCRKAFTNKYDLARHVKLHNASKETRSETYPTPSTSAGEISGNGKQCELCGRCCRNLSEFQKHVRGHTGERPFKCSYYKKTFKSTRLFKLLCKDTHPSKLEFKLEKPYVCKFCGKGFAQTSNLYAHENIHSTDKPFTCYLCFNSFNHKRDLQRYLEKCTN